MMGDMKKLMQQAQEMQQRIGELQEKLAEEESEGTAGGGMVTVTLNGKGEMLRTSIDPSLLAADEKEVVEDLIVAAFTDAKNKVEENFNEQMAEIAGNMGLPPGMKLPF